MRVVLGSTLAFGALMAVVMHHTFDGTAWIELFCVSVYASGFGNGNGLLFHWFH